MKLDLETLKQVKFTFDLHSDHSTNCNGYRRLCEIIKEEEKEATQLASDNSSERIICAANYYNDGKSEVHGCKNIEVGFVICGYRHHNCIETFANMVGFPYSDEANKLRNTEIQGFLTSKNRFVSREEALIIALRENQVMDIKEVRGNELFSEDLY